MLDRKSSTPLYHQATNWLRGRINSGELSSGNQIPSEWEMADVLGISRITARQAITELVREGLLFRRTGKGTFVASPKTHSKLSTLVGFSEKMQKLGHTVTSEVLEIEIESIDSFISEKLQLESGHKIIKLKRLRMLNNEPVAIQWSYFPYPRCSALLEVDFTKESLIQSIVQKCGIRAKNSIDQVSLTFVSGKDAVILNLKQRTPMLLIEGVLYSDSGDPIRYGKGMYRGDKFKLTVENYSVE